MRLEERIVLDGAALTTLEHGTTPLTDTTPLAEPDASAHAPAEGARDLKKSSDAEQGSSTSSQPETKEPKNTDCQDLPCAGIRPGYLRSLFRSTF